MTVPPTTLPPGDDGASVACSLLFKPEGVLHVRAWAETRRKATIQIPVEAAECWADILDEEGVVVGRADGEGDPAGSEYAVFLIGVVLASEHNYTLKVKISMPSVPLDAYADFPLPTVS